MICTLAIITALTGFSAQALEPKNPETLCERFIDEKQQGECQAKVKKIQPDWYLSALCEKVFDNKKFFECIEMSAKADFSPDSLQACDEAESTDEDRLSCIKKQARNGGAYQTGSNRMPSSVDSAGANAHSNKKKANTLPKKKK